MNWNHAICLAFIMAVCSHKSATCQDSTQVKNELSKFFKNGVLIENLGVTVPWDLKLKDISKYGNPKVVKSSKRRFILLWDSATIWGGTKIDLRFISAILGGGHKKIKATNLLGPISVKDGERLRHYFEKYYGPPNRVGRSRGFKSYLWKIDEGSGIFLLLHEHRDEGHLEITKQEEISVQSARTPLD